MSQFLYFAYGSNMLGARLRARTPSARRVAVARLPGHALRWHKAGNDGSGKCDVVAATDTATCVYGVLYEIALAEKTRLDRAESLGVGYAETLAPVHAVDDAVRPVPGDRSHRGSGRWLEARLYVALQVDADRQPYDWYRALVVAGARENALPAAYVARLEAVPAWPDPDPERARRHVALVTSARS